MSTQTMTKAANSGCCSKKRCDEAEPCIGEGFQRPRFFAGQLLTEDDLESLSSYVVGKNRLHNRYLWGDGVVCGLEIKPHPCGGGRVLVEPGYALDCCGNDLLLPCQEELDINALVRQLRIELRGGYDCGDPCAGGKQDTAAYTDTEAGGIIGLSMAEPVSKQGERGNMSRKLPVKTERYCLYLRYSETQSDPVSPYQVDEPCSGSNCEWTRVNEGVRFELRCYTPPCDENELCERLKDCLGDVYALENNLTQANDLQQSLILYSALMAPSDQAGAVPLLHVGDGASLSESAEVLDQFFMDYEAHKDSPEALNSVKVVKAMNAAADASAYLTRYRLMKGEDRAALMVEADKAAEEGEAKVHLGEVLERVSGLVKKLDKVEEPVLTLHVKDPLILESSKSALRIVKDLGAELDPLPEEKAKDSETLQLALKAFATPETFRVIGERFSGLKDGLVQRLSAQADPVHRELLFSIQSKGLPVLKMGQRLSANQMRQFTEAGALVVGGYKKLLQECLCQALLPECGDCEDPVVLLACLEMNDCEVVEICNMVRKFVITPPNLRYWFPVIGKLGRGLTETCCPDTSCDPWHKPPMHDDLLDRQDSYYGARSRYGNLAGLAASTRLLSLLLGDCLKFGYGRQDKLLQTSSHAVKLMYQLSGGGMPGGIPISSVPPQLSPGTPPRTPPWTPSEKPPTWIPVEEEQPRIMLDEGGLIDWTRVPYSVAPPADFLVTSARAEIDVKTVLDNPAARDALAKLVEEKVNKLVVVETGTDVNALIAKKVKEAESKGAAEMERLMTKKLAEAETARAAELNKLVEKKINEVAEVRLKEGEAALNEELKKRLAVKELAKVVDSSAVVKRLSTSIKNLQAKNRDLEREVKRLQGS